MAKKAGLSVHVRSANRLSLSGTGTGGGASIPIQRAAATGPAIATLVQKRIAADAVAVGLAAARRSTAAVDEPRPAASTEPNTSASGASAAAAASAACHAVSCAVIVCPPGSGRCEPFRRYFALGARVKDRSFPSRARRNVGARPERRQQNPQRQWVSGTGPRLSTVRMAKTLCAVSTAGTARISSSSTFS